MFEEYLLNHPLALIGAIALLAVVYTGLNAVGGAIFLLTAAAGSYRRSRRARLPPPVRGANLGLDSTRPPSP